MTKFITHYLTFLHIVLSCSVVQLYCWFLYPVYILADSRKYSKAMVYVTTSRSPTNQSLENLKKKKVIQYTFRFSKPIKFLSDVAIFIIYIVYFFCGISKNKVRTLFIATCGRIWRWILLGPNERPFLQ